MLLTWPWKAHIVQLRYFANRHDPFRERTQRLPEFDCSGAERAHEGCGSTIGSRFDGTAGLGARRSGTLVLVEPSPLLKIHDRRLPLFFGPPAIGAKALPCESEGAFDNGTTSTIPCPSVSETVPNVVGMYTPTGGVRVQEAGLQPAPRTSTLCRYPKATSSGPRPRQARESRARTQVIVFNSLGPQTTGSLALPPGTNCRRSGICDDE